MASEPRLALIRRNCFFPLAGTERFPRDLHSALTCRRRDHGSRTLAQTAAAWVSPPSAVFVTSK
jgi:hypothetical protein